MIKPVPPAGTKRICPVCTAKFYDLNRKPVVCPKCASEVSDAVVVVS
jgi:uncharacterized protein (TIGR02300 family)